MNSKMGIGENSGLLPDEEFEFINDKKLVNAICIPAYNERSLLPVIRSLMQCTPISGTVLCIAINASENTDDEIRKTNRLAFLELRSFIEKERPFFGVHVGLYNRLPEKKSGVGLARKLAMDKACKLVETKSDRSLLICLDADCTVEPNYLTAIENYFLANSEIHAASVYFEHPEPENTQLKEAIVSYELHLRYLKNSLCWAGYPWYYHTVGSCMALRVNTYLKNGGMNTRKAGEDFYFLHKLMPLGFGEITNTAVYPAVRISDRVPFGTGRSMLEWPKKNGILNTYNFHSFEVLKQFFDGVKGHTGLDNWDWNSEIHAMLRAFFVQEGMDTEWISSKHNTRSKEAALQRFYKWFSGFQIIRCLHYLRENGFPDAPVFSEAGKLLTAKSVLPEARLLHQFRKLDKNE